MKAQTLHELVVVADICQALFFVLSEICRGRFAAVAFLYYHARRGSASVGHVVGSR